MGVENTQIWRTWCPPNIDFQLFQVKLQIFLDFVVKKCYTESVDLIFVVFFIKGCMGIYYSLRRSKEDRLALKLRLVDMLGGKCVDCGYNQHLAALDFDHKEPKFKSFNIAEGLNKYSDNQVIMEAHKCVLRCANCHRVKTHPNYGKEAKDGPK